MDRTATPPRILVVEPNDRLRNTMRLHLTLGGYRCESTRDGFEALPLLETVRLDLAVINLGAPGLDALRRRSSSDDARRGWPTLLLAPERHHAEALAALEQWADGYVPAPVGMRELVAHAGTLLRRGSLRRASSVADPVLENPVPVIRNGVAIDPARRRVQVDGHDVSLSNQEFQLLYLLAGRPDVVFERETLMAKLWGDDTFVEPRSVDAVVARLRRRLKSADPPLRIVSFRGVGYALARTRGGRPDHSTSANL